MHFITILEHSAKLGIHMHTWTSDAFYIRAIKQSVTVKNISAHLRENRKSRTQTKRGCHTECSQLQAGLRYECKTRT